MTNLTNHLRLFLCESFTCLSNGKSNPSLFVFIVIRIVVFWLYFVSFMKFNAKTSVQKAAIKCINTYGGVSFYFSLSNQRSLCSRSRACAFASGSCVSYAGSGGGGHSDLTAQG